MKKKDVKVGGIYSLRIHGQYQKVRIESVDEKGGWWCTVLISGRRIHLDSARSLHEDWAAV